MTITPVLNIDEQSHIQIKRKNSKQPRTAITTQKHRNKNNKQRQRTIGATTNAFDAAFTPDAIFLERAKENTNNNCEIEAIVQNDQMKINSTDPSLLVQVPTGDDRQIANASRAEAATFTATVTAILDAAANVT